MGALELLFDYFEDHRRAAELIAQRRPVALGILGFAVGALSLFVAQAVAGRLWPLTFGWSSLGLMLLWKLTTGFFLAAIVHLILDLGGVRGSGSTLFVHLGLASVAWALAVPLSLLARLAAPTSNLAMTAAFFAVGLLSVFLKARSIQDNYGVSGARAWTTLGLPYLALAAAFAVAIGLTAVIAFLQVMKAFD
jgi:hypothetical protein